MNKGATRTTIIISLLIVALVGYYAYLSNKDRARREESAVTAVEAALSRDLNKDYPPTPKEVIKYYNELLRCLYNEESSQDEIEALGLKARELYDEELLEANELGGYLIRLQSDVNDYRNNNRRITNFSVASSNNVEMFEQDGYSFAKIMCGYNIMQGGQSHPSDQVYLLRKDADRRWKIYGWEAAENLETQVE
ncbi:MAG: hypothetical protein K2H41_04740 [Acetatifactor sp.]|nr:hypothetical protein [Acetatifactor sp.]